MIECRILGPVELRVDGEEPPPQLLWRKNVALLVYLARSPNYNRSREHLVGLLWGDTPDRSARHSLREALRIIKKHLGEDGMRIEGDQIAVNPQAIQLDTERFDEHYGAGEWAAAAELVRGELLEGFALPGAQEFDAWLMAERNHWKQLSLEALTAHAEELMSEGELSSAAGTLARGLSILPHHEPAVRAAIKCAALRGDRASALERYLQLEQELNELGSAPNPETSRLYEQVQQERTWRLPSGVIQSTAGGMESRRMPLVGRGASLAEANSHWRRTLDGGEHSLILVEGDPGTGKTRLAEEIVARARLDGAAVTSVRAVEADVDEAGGGMLALARGGLIDAQGMAGAAPAALAVFARHIPDWGDKFRIAISETSALRLGPALAEILRAITEEQPVLLHVDDSHWLDSESLKAIGLVLRDLRERPISVLLSYTRTHDRVELDELKSRIARDVKGCCIEVGSLESAHLEQLTEFAMPTYDAEQVKRLARRVAHETAGLPLLAVEVLHAVACWDLELDEKRPAWPQPFKTLDQAMPADLPDTVVAAIRAGFRKLSRNTRDLVAAASVLGDRISIEKFRKIAELSPDELTAALDEAEWQRWLVAEPRGYSFVAKIVRDVVARDMISEARRQRVIELTGS